MDLNNIMLSEINQSQRANLTLFHLYELSKTVKVLETERSWVVSRGWGEREMKVTVQ